MTSSLVGSEMCIRDRCAGVQLCSCGAVELRRAPVGAMFCHSAVWGVVTVCLLYTSDAADDM
eukprot:7721882-Prorocentrum_lima.AAC.1